MLTQITKKMWIAVCFVALCVLCPALVAQSTSQGAINGTVFDSTGAAIANVTINIHCDATNGDDLGCEW